MRCGSWAAISVMGLGFLVLRPSPARCSDPAEVTWERLRELAGRWQGRSSKGWEETIDLRLIAAGSVLLETSIFADDPKATNAMATAYYMDGDRLMLTHYCESRNAPRLVASDFGDNREVTFTFVDGANIPSRNKGHMDRVRMHFQDRDHFSSRWTWYQDGTERWLEDILYERMRQ